MSWYIIVPAVVVITLFLLLIAGLMRAAAWADRQMDKQLERDYERLSTMPVTSANSASTDRHVRILR